MNMKINSSTSPYLSSLITKTILYKICSGNLSLRYGVQNLKTGKNFKGLAALVLGNYVAEHNVPSYQFATFDHLGVLHLQLEKGAKSIHVPLLVKTTPNEMNLNSVCFFGTHQLVGFANETKPKFDVLSFYQKNNLDPTSPNIYLDLVHLVEDRVDSIDTKFTDLVYNIVAAYFSDILGLNIPQKDVKHFYGKLKLEDIRSLVLLANQIVEEFFMVFMDGYCAQNVAQAHLARLKSLLKT